jgi:hypothetical protein
MAREGMIRKRLARGEEIKKRVQDLVKKGKVEMGVYLGYQGAINFWESLRDLAVREVYNRVKANPDALSKGFVWKVLEEIGAREFEKLLKKYKVGFAMILSYSGRWIRVRSGREFVGNEHSQRILDHLIVYGILRRVEELLKRKRK